MFILTVCSGVGKTTTAIEIMRKKVDYIRYFYGHDSLGDMKFERFDITGREPDEVAEYVLSWVHRKLE